MSLVHPAALIEAAAMPQVALGGEVGGAAGSAIGSLFGKKGKKIGRKVGKIAGKVLGHFGFQDGGRVRRPPVKPAVMPYRKGGAVPFNKKPRHMVGGGSVIAHPLMSKKQRAEDSVRAILQPGELVVPVKYYQKGKRKGMNLAEMTMKEFKHRGIKLPGMK